MRASAPVAAFFVFLVAVSVVLAGIASTLALARAQVEHLDADLASLIRADYSADPEGTTFAPLDERIIDTVREDEERLRDRSSGVEIVPVYRDDRPDDAATDDGSGATVSTPGTTPPPGWTPAPGTTPEPGETPPPGITPAPGKTPTPTPPAAPDPTPPPPPPPPDSFTFYLHNNPSPPTGDTTSQTALPIDATPPTAHALYNYDADRDASPGQLIKKGGERPTESDPRKYQAWRSPVLASDLTFQADVVVHLWSAMEDFELDKKGSVTVSLRDFDGSGYTEIGEREFTDSDWQDGFSGWVLKTFAIEVESYTVAAGHRLELKVIVDKSSEDDMWFAYDTVTYPSRITVSY